jgi:hypothetical protein
MSLDIIAVEQNDVLFIRWPHVRTNVKSKTLERIEQEGPTYPNCRRGTANPVVDRNR